MHLRVAVSGQREGQAEVEGRAPLVPPAGWECSLLRGLLGCALNFFG